MRNLAQRVKQTGKEGNYIYGTLEAITKGRAAVLITGSSQRLTGLEILSDNLEIGQQVIVDYSSGVPPFVRGHGTAVEKERKVIEIGFESILGDVALEDVSVSVFGRGDQIISKGRTLLWFSSEVFDEYGMFSSYNPTQFIIPMDGVYYATAQVILEGIYCDYSHNNRVWMELRGATYGTFATSVTHQYQHAPAEPLTAQVQGVITALAGEIVTVYCGLDYSFGQATVDLLPNHYGPYAALSPTFQMFKIGGGFFLENVDGLFFSEFPGYSDPPRIELDGNTGYIYVAETLDYGRAIANTTKENNQNLVTDFQFQEVSEGESYFSVFLKTSSDWMNWSTPTTGYELQISSRGGWSVWRYNSGVQTLLESYNSNATTLWQKLEFEVSGSSVRAKVWVKSGSEPGWQVDYTDGSPLTSAGRMQLGHFNSSGSRWLRVDNLDLTTP